MEHSKDIEHAHEQIVMLNKGVDNLNKVVDEIAQNR